MLCFLLGMLFFCALHVASSRAATSLSLLFSRRKPHSLGAHSGEAGSRMVTLPPGLPVWLFQTKFVIFGFFSIPLAFSFLKKGHIEFGFFGLFRQIGSLCRFGTFKDDFWQNSGHWKISRHYFWTQNHKFLLETLHKNL